MGYEAGEDLFVDIYEDLQEKVGKSAVEQLNQIEKLLTHNLTNHFQDVADNVVSIFSSLSPLSDGQKEHLDADLSKLKISLDGLEAEVKKEKKEEESGEGIDQVLDFITLSRGLLSEAYGGQKIVWDKVKQLQVQLYKAMYTIGESSSELKEHMRTLIKTLKEIDLEDIGKADSGKQKLILEGSGDYIDSDDEEDTQN